MKLTNRNFFFCYNKHLFSYLKDVKGIEFITVAKNPTTGKVFSMFYITDELQIAINEYKATRQDQD